MPVPVPAASWAGSLLWLIGLSVAAFAVSWLLANRLRTGRFLYIGALFLVTGALSAGYVVWLGLGAGEVLTTRWGWGLLAAPIAGAFPAFGMTRLPASNRRTGRALGLALVWEGVVYGVSEGVLLSALPAFMTWQLVHSLGWGGFGGGLARWMLPVAASIVVIVVHHLGYAEYRNRQLVPISAGCGLLTVGYVVTASVIAPMLGHVLMHTVAILRGTELPPLTRPVTAPAPRMQAASQRAGRSDSPGRHRPLLHGR
jgi:hypothetical protein